MRSGYITDYIDIAQVVLYGFWIFFAGLILHLRREDKREGYPLESDRTHRAPSTPVVGFPAPPPAKRWRMPHGEDDLYAPRKLESIRKIEGVVDNERPLLGYPLVPTGNPLRQAVGPASYVARRNIPDLTLHGDPKIAPISRLEGYKIAAGDPDPRGMPVVAADGLVAGVVEDLWVDRAEPRILYFQIALDEKAQNIRNEAFTTHRSENDSERAVPDLSRHVLVPTGLAKVQARHARVKVASILAADFAYVPMIASDRAITRLEEDQIMSYFGGGHLFRGKHYAELR